MNKTDPKFPQIRSLSKPIMRKSACPNYDSSIQDIPSLFVCQNELERTKDEIYHLKKSINKKSNEITQTKADITRYEETLKKNLKVIEDISLTTDKSTSIAIGRLLFDPNQASLPTEITLSPEQIVKFKELLAVNLLKSKNKELSEVISSKKSEIDVLKSDSKTNSITKLENTFLLNATELKELKINYDSLQSKYKEMYTQAEKIIGERDQLKIDMNKYKAEYLASKAKLAQLKSNQALKPHGRVNDSLILSDKKEGGIKKEFNSSNASQHTKEQSDNSLNKNSMDNNGKILINAYLSEKAKLEKKIEELCNANLEADESSEAKERELKKRVEEYNGLLEKSKRLHYELEAKKRDSDKEEALKKEIEKLKKEKNSLNDKINNMKEKDLTAKLDEVKQRMKELESGIKAEKEKNIELKETIESDKINERILEKKISDDRNKIEKLRKEIEEMKKQQEIERQSKVMPLPVEERDNFFATGINLNAKSRYDVNIEPEEPVHEEEEQEQEQEQEKEKEQQLQQKQSEEDNDLEKELESEKDIEKKDEQHQISKNDEAPFENAKEKENDSVLDVEKIEDSALKSHANQNNGDNNEQMKDEYNDNAQQLNQGEEKEREGEQQTNKSQQKEEANKSKSIEEQNKDSKDQYDIIEDHNNEIDL